MKQGRYISFVGSTVTSIKPVHSKFNHKQRYAIDVIVEKLNKRLLDTEKLHQAKRPYNKEDIIKLVESIFVNNKCSSYDEAINILNKQLKEKNFDIH